MKNIILLLSLIVFFISCTPEGRQHRKEQKLARLIKANPNLAVTDTIKKDTMVSVPVLHESIDLDLSESDSLIDSIARHFYSSVDSNIMDTIASGFKAILKKSGDIDTIMDTKRQDGGPGNSKVHIVKKGNKLNIDIVTTPPPVKFTAPIAVTKYNIPPVELKWYEKIFKFINTTVGLLGFSLIILILLYVIYKVAKWVVKHG